jgi:hypothetical protein
MAPNSGNNTVAVRSTPMANPPAAIDSNTLNQLTIAKTFAPLIDGDKFDGTLPKGDSLSLVLNNSAGAATKNYYLFGSSNMIAANIASYNAPDSGSDGAAGKTLTDLIQGGQKVSINAVILKTNTGGGATQFTNNIIIAQGGIDGTNNPYVLRPVTATSPQNYIADQLNLQANYVLGRTSFAYVTVGVGITLTVTLFVSFN